MVIKKNIILQTEYIKAYKCKQDFIQHHLNYVKRIHQGNKLIISSQLAGLIPQFKVASKSIINLTKMAQEIGYLNYLSKLLQNKNCPAYFFSAISSSTPFDRGPIVFKREKNQTVSQNKYSYKKIIWFKHIKLKIEILWKIKHEYQYLEKAMDI